jgi:hypothetical protein
VIGEPPLEAGRVHETLIDEFCPMASARLGADGGAPIGDVGVAVELGDAGEVPATFVAVTLTL